MSSSQDGEDAVDDVAVDGSSLPDEIWVKVAEGLEARDLSVLSHVNRRLLAICTSESLWRSLCLRDFAVPHGNREIYMEMEKKTNCSVNFRSRRPVYTGFDAVHVGRGVRYNEYDHSSHHFIYPVPSGALFLVFTLPRIPERGMILSIKHMEHHLREEGEHHGAYVDIFVNDLILLSRYSPCSAEYKVEDFEIPSRSLRTGRNVVRWNYIIGSSAFYWIQEVQMASVSNK
ncbi:hypothetical protein NDN08_006204 [Rhodosorus marinus]|uniref:F-box domain-containing protein n=1 Tax=Rhodosorus marinus TaxID=101924 RepID=A0AAV8UK44_9RHOD|nr:hypothetical protein NDN08_006204 [Rhodosorus marinus]